MRMWIDGNEIDVAEGTSAMAAAMAAVDACTRTSVRGERRGPLCGMGACYECRAEVDGNAHCRTCLLSVKEGTTIRTTPKSFGERGQNRAEYDIEKTCDYLVVGSGPAGLSAAMWAAKRGMNVLVVDSAPQPGGQIWRATEGKLNSFVAVFLHDKERVELLSNASVYDIRPEERVAYATSLADQQAFRIRYQAAVLATGARELFLPFPGWTLPNVMGIGGLQAAVKAGLEVSGKRIVLGGTGPLLLAVAKYLIEHGADVRCIAEQASMGQVMRFGAQSAFRYFKWGDTIRYLPLLKRLRTDQWIRRADGGSKVERVTVTDGQTDWEVECDYVGCAYGLVPNTELARLAGCEIKNGVVKVDSEGQTSVQGILCAGEPTGVAGVTFAAGAGHRAALQGSGRISPEGRMATWNAQRRFTRLLEKCFALRPDLRLLAEDETIVCRCEDVAYGQLTGCTDEREAKLHTRCGMGACQGRICGAANQVLFGWQPNTVQLPAEPTRVRSLIADR